jgi:hypothetical protein
MAASCADDGIETQIENHSIQARGNFLSYGRIRRKIQVENLCEVCLKI